MKKIARKIIHYVGVAVKMPFVVLFCVSFIALYFLQILAVCVRVMFDEPDVKYPMVIIMDGLRDIADDVERAIMYNE
jgi:hypothetical protein